MVHRVRKVRNPSGACDGGLDVGIGRLHHGVGVGAGELVADALDVRLQGLSKPLEGGQARAARPADPATHQRDHRKQIEHTGRFNELIDDFLSE